MTDEYNLYQQAIKKWGEPSQVMMLFEEVGELQQAISKYYRAANGQKGIKRMQIIEEIADVDIMLSEMLVLYGVTEEEYSATKAAKIKKLQSQLQE